MPVIFSTRVIDMIGGSSALIQAIDSKTREELESYFDEAKLKLENSPRLLQEGFLYVAGKKSSEIIKLFLTKFPALDNRSLIEKAIKKALEEENSSALSFLLTSKHLTELDREYYQVLSPAETDSLMAAPATNTAQTEPNAGLGSLMVNLSNFMLSETPTEFAQNIEPRRQRSAVRPPEVQGPAITVAKNRDAAKQASEPFIRQRAVANAGELARTKEVNPKSNTFDKRPF